eukprot:gene13816-biopygen18582
MARLGRTLRAALGWARLSPDIGTNGITAAPQAPLW